MKVIWVVNIIMPELAAHYALNNGVGGGWLIGLQEDIKSNDSFQSVILCPTDNDRLVREKTLINNTIYYFFKRNASGIIDTETVELFSEILFNEKPDVIHIWGTEYLQGYEMYVAAEKQKIVDRIVVSIQGLVSVYAKHYYAGLPERIVKHKSLREILKHDNIEQNKRQFEYRGKYEIELIKNIKHVIGRTDWDYACVKQINPDIEYHFCNETLRASFYQDTWNYDCCEKYRIFFTQCSVPLKGFHSLIEALPLICSRYPKTKVYIAGNDPNKCSGYSQKLKQRSYELYLGKLIKKYNLSDRIIFLDTLSENQMKEQYLKSNVFVLGSFIENSPNSLGEAMLLGVPIVASYVGGVATMLKDKDEGFLYDVNAPYMLAHYVCEIFEKGADVRYQCEQAQKHANITHNKQKNLNQLMSIYSEASNKAKRNCL